MPKILERPKTRLGTAGLRAFFKVCDQWNLHNDQQIRLLGVPDTTFYAWKKKLDQSEFSISKDTLERISYILGIYKNLHTLFTDAEAADSWVQRPNAASIFNEKSAIDRMTEGNVADLYVVRKYLDEQVKGW
jgi:uncharacterized protein (DUF2384 family)